MTATETTTVATATATPVTAKKAPKSKKAAPAKKAPAPKKVTKKAVDGSLRGVAKPAGWEPSTKMGGFDPKNVLSLRKPQVRLLAVLVKAKGPMSRKVLSEKSGVEYAWLCNWIGQPDAEARKGREARWGFTSLLTLKFVTVKQIDVDDRPTWVYEITASGRTALAKYEAAAKEKAKASK